MPEAADVRRRVIAEMLAAGFELRGGLLVPPQGDPKEVARSLHAQQRAQVLAKSLDFIVEWEDRLIDYFADGREVDPSAIHPVVAPVTTEEQSALFRFASLHWAVPVSQGYGRRTRFLITDKNNGKLIGIFALGDPVFNLRVRDSLIGWDGAQREARLYNVFDAFVLGALDPYRQLIAGKLAALCTVSDEVTSFLEEKYKGKVTKIRGEEKISRPVLITTSSALGRSSIYNRVVFSGRKVFQPVGYTEGFGHFQFSDELFRDLVDTISEDESYRSHKYGDGPNWKMRTIRTALERLGLPGDMLKHGIRREVFLAPLSIGWRAFLRGETDVISPISYPLDDLAEHYRRRWAEPRAERMPGYRDWDRENMRLTKLYAKLPARQMLLF